MPNIGVRQADGSTVFVDAEDIGGGILQVNHRFVAPSAFFDGEATSTGAASNVTLASTQALELGVTVKADPDNVDDVIVGAASGAVGFKLQPGDETFIPIDDLAKVICHFLAGAPDKVSYQGA